ncbi:Pseudouridine kinase [Saliniradius amylolyticus]|uniref:Pseudouridine kinase n=1 Tax=Saliniradius amylolyticus TaxID=2183582 RepID=A0A2S2DYP0_9ALTE|nr:class I SAM-dependent methyltransferase [Saliniradius amylolyticus]AWL10525.1 Pseudouridine kinase [Saliniradius amylolyticus]
MQCPLCRSNNYQHYHSDPRRDYYQCQSCQLVYVPDEQRLDAHAEKAEYDLHNNQPDDPGYRRFLSRITVPVCQRVTPASRGLDFGSGPCPVLAMMLTEQGFDMTCYDPFYAPETQALKRRYDFITSTEVVEHLFEPGKELARLLDCLRPRGQLFIMTKRVIDHSRFQHWHYKNDPTHVCFFSDASFHWFAERHQLQLSLLGPDVVVLTRP